MSDSHNTEPELPRSVLEEIRALLPDVHEDFNRTILVTNVDLHRYFRELALDLLTSGRDVNLMLDDFAGGFLWMVLIGREHAIRGYAPILPRDDVEGRDLISDDAINALIDAERDQ